MKSASNGDVLNGSLQMLHVHVLLVSPLGASHMAQSSTDQHEGRVAVREAAHHAGTAADLPVQPFNDINASAHHVSVCSVRVDVDKNFPLHPTTFCTRIYRVVGKKIDIAAQLCYTVSKR